MRIAVDIDDTLNIVKRVEQAGAYIARKGLPFRLKNPVSNKMVEIFDWTIEDVLHFVREEGGVALYTDALAREGAKEALEGWRKLGHEVVILTSRKKEWYGDPERASREWLEKRQIPYDEIVAEIPMGGKGKYCDEHGISVLVDDDPEACLSAQRCGVTPVLALGRHNEAFSNAFSHCGATWRQIDNTVKNIISTL